MKNLDPEGENFRQTSESRKLGEQSQSESFRSKESLFIGRTSPMIQGESSQREKPSQLKINVREYQDRDQDFMDQLRQEHLLASAPQSRLTDLSKDEIEEFSIEILSFLPLIDKIVCPKKILSLNIL